MRAILKFKKFFLTQQERFHSSSKFIIEELTATATINEQVADTFIRVLEGKLTGMHAKSLLPLEYCQQLEKRFHSSPLKKSRIDGVPGFEAGVTQYKKRPESLAKLAYEQHGQIREILGRDADNPIMNFFHVLARQAAKRGYLVRAATFNAEPMTIIRFCQWIKQKENDSLLVQMHDDLAQVKASLNKGFEIHDVQRLVAYNFYPKAKKNSGQLYAIDWQPTHDERMKFGVSDTGYPYRLEDVPVTAKKKYVFNQESGDLIVLDSSYVHGVLVGEDKCNERLVANGFAALLPNKNIVLFA